MEKKIIIGCDHGGYSIKEQIKVFLEKRGYRVKDVGTHSEESVNYPDFAHPVASAVNNAEFEKGILICGSGNGVSIVANKYPEIRCALAWDPELSRLARLHNDANILSLPGRFITVENALQCIRLFLETEFEGGRHKNRVEAINKIKQ